MHCNHLSYFPHVTVLEHKAAQDIQKLRQGLSFRLPSSRRPSVPRITALQYNILLLQSQTDRCESDIHNDMYDSITDNCHAGQYCMGNTATIVTTGSIQEIAKYNIYNLYICASSNIVSRLQAGGAVE